MKLIYGFFASRSSIPLRQLAWAAAVAAISSTLVLYVLNSGAEQAAHGAALGRLLVVFLVAEIMFVVTSRHFQLAVLRETEKVLNVYRQEQIERARHCDLDRFERIGPARIFGAITQQTKLLSSSIVTIVMALQFMGVVIVALAYLAWLNLAAFLLMIAILAVGGLVYRSRMNAAYPLFAEAAKKENEFFDSINDLVAGFKEVRLNARRSADFATHATGISRDVAAIKGEIDVKLTDLFCFSQLVFTGAAAAMVFLLPGLGVVQSTEVLKILTSVMFLIGPIVNIMSTAAVVAQATSACVQMTALEKELIDAAGASRATSEQPRRFDEIRLEGVSFRHSAADGADGFQVGPVDLVLRAGEVLFISGGNGSGKSTLLRLLTALYLPQAGQIVLDGQPIEADRREAYQSLFSTVFSDFHLFERTFGLGDVEDETISRWLATVGLEGKTQLANRRFDTIKLSTGQRKRLALVVALLEDRPIYVLDEFAADQDPGFRRKFYDEILPAMRERGKTVVVVTHDERYFDRASRHITMEEGRVARGEMSDA